MPSTLELTWEDANIQIANVTIKSSTSKKLSEVTIDNKLKFDKHIENICQKACRKLNAPVRLVNYIKITLILLN